MGDAEAERAPLEGTGKAAVTLGRLWTRRFPGNVALYVRIDVASHSPAYRVTDGPPAEGEFAARLLATEAMSGTQDLSERMDWGVVALGARGLVVHRPDVAFEVPAAHLEPVDSARPVDVRRQGRLAPFLSGAGGLGATLYELNLSGGRVRYSTHPDDAVAHPELGGPVASPWQARPGVTAGSAAPVLQEVVASASGGVGYVTGPVGPDGGDRPGPVLGGVSPHLRSGVPLIRLRPGPPLPQSAAEPGHRLAVDWRPLADVGFVVEGAVGYAWNIDPLEAPLHWWHRRGAETRLLTLGHRPDGGGWGARGHAGPGLATTGHRARARPPVGLSAGDQLVYAVDPAEFLAVGFTCERVVAKVSLVRRPGTVPLWRTAVNDDSPWRITTCPADGAADGYVRQGVVGHLLAAHPPPGADEVRHHAPRGVVPAGLAVGPVPGGLPVYLVSGGGERWATTSLACDLEEVAVEEVLGYLPPAAGPAGA